MLTNQDLKNIGQLISESEQRVVTQLRGQMKDMESNLRCEMKPK